MGFELVHLYFGCLALGLGYAVIIFVLGNMGGDQGSDGVEGNADFGQIDGAHDTGLGHDPGEAPGDSPGFEAGEAGLSPFSPLMLATFSTLFGGLGLITSGLMRMFPLMPMGVANIVSLVFSGLMAILLASYFSYFLIRVFVKSETSTDTSSTQLIGSDATVSEEIHPGQIGEVTYRLGGGRNCSMAKLFEGQEPIRRGQKVEIVALKESVLYVRLKQETEDPPPDQEQP